VAESKHRLAFIASCERLKLEKWLEKIWSV